jgi:hypothetical protein
VNSNALGGRNKRIAERLHSALGSARSVLNVGAGAGSISKKYHLLEQQACHCGRNWRAAFTRIETDKRVELDGIFVLGFDETGLCTELREWWHLRDLP